MKIKQSYNLSCQSKSRIHRMFAPSRLAALVKEMIELFSCPNHGWNAVNSEENVDSQSSQLEEEDLQKLEDDCVPVNTKKQTSWGLKKFTQWLEERKISCDRHTVSPTELNKILRIFLPRWKQTRKQTSRQVPWLVYELLFTVQLRDNLFQGR